MLRSSDLSGIEIVLEPVVHGLEHARGHKMRIDHGVHGAILEPARSRDAQTRGAVLKSPIGKYRRPEARVPQPAIGIHRRAADGGQPAEMFDDAADRLQPDLTGQLTLSVSGMKVLSPPVE